ncbi:hypothetical protein BZA05DRAFT_254350 [Tricharina praecox]|uniref:uncharacterized protein n=1 Tax=Tricharina praecox TaxID=43433 RepID=UPI00221ED623|nr:uncharacterized protein BZA05DRAFT_254350 [Tricharina praecox]KAI5854958.1 hypothetical protein BZA05DRAFT_254350 [Tricharina praecox]
MASMGRWEGRKRGADEANKPSAFDDPSRCSGAEYSAVRVRQVISLLTYLGLQCARLNYPHGLDGGEEAHPFAFGAFAQSGRQHCYPDFPRPDLSALRTVHEANTIVNPPYAIDDTRSFHSTAARPPFALDRPLERVGLKGKRAHCSDTFSSASALPASTTPSSSRQLSSILPPSHPMMIAGIDFRCWLLSAAAKILLQSCHCWRAAPDII